MYAIVRENVFDVPALARGQAQLDEFQRLHASQRGYVGTVTVELEPGHWISINLWQSSEDAAAALPVMGPAVQRLLEPMMAAPSRMLGAGPVVLTDMRGAAADR
jgi:hypothetical protein